MCAEPARVGWGVRVSVAYVGCAVEELEPMAFLCGIGEGGADGFENQLEGDVGAEALYPGRDAVGEFVIRDEACEVGCDLVDGDVGEFSACVVLCSGGLVGEVPAYVAWEGRCGRSDDGGAGGGLLLLVATSIARWRT